MGSALVAFAISLVIGGAFARTPAMSRFVTRSAEGPRWRMDAVPLAGGIAMGAGFGVAIALFARDADGIGAVLAASFAALAVGLVDDVRALSPIVKLGGQLAAGLVLVIGGVQMQLPGGDAVGAVATVVWVAVAINAVNIFDNIDAAAGGVMLVSAATLGAWWMLGSGPSELPAALAGGIGGFLVFNLHPARIFMGDSGSHLLGAALAALTVLDGGRAGSGRPASWVFALAVPLVLVAVPLFDAAFVTVERIRHGRPIWVGGRDHTSHRLVALGLGVGPVAVVLGLAAAVAAGVASLAPLDGPWFAIAAGALALAGIFTWWRLARVEV
jgi:UDP-GlcNAc:undecaprenyl-phosphate GlcNAc-1-phosphate transferase